MNRVLIYSVLLALLASCSIKNNLPEGEILYRGIKDISYGDKSSESKKQDKTSQSEGVITAVANAINKIDNFLLGKSDIQSSIESLKMQRNDKSLTKTQRDSLKAEYVLMTRTLENAKEEVDAALSCAPNGSIFGSSKITWPIPVRLNMYNYFQDSRTVVGKWILNTFCESPVLLSNVNPATRTLVARNILRNYGFLLASTDYEVLPLKDSLCAKIKYNIHPNMLFRLDSVQRLSINHNIDSILQTTNDASLLVKGNPFNASDLDQERVRLSDVLRNNGYFNFEPTYFTYKADTIQRKNWVQLRVETIKPLPRNATKRYVLGNTTIRLLKYADTDIVDSITYTPQIKPRKRTLLKSNRRNRHRFPAIKMLYSGNAGYEPMKLTEFRKYLNYEYASPYSVNQIENIRNNIAQMGVFSHLQLNYQCREASDSIANDTLDLLINAMLDKQYDSEFAANIIGKNNGLIGPGLSYSISKKNAFRRAETMKLKLYGSYEWQTGTHDDPNSDNNLLNCFEFGGQLSLSYPRLLAPITRKQKRRIKGSTDFLVDISWLNRGGYYSMAQFKADQTYRFYRKSNLSHTLTPISLKFTSLQNCTNKFNTILNNRPLLNVSMRNQFVPSAEYSFTRHNQRIVWKNSFTLTVKEAGNLTSALYAACGNKFNEKDKLFLGVPFAQFLKVNIDFKQEKRLTPKQSIVAHLSAGAVYAYGNSATAPYSDLFSVGGANSIRAFCLRGVGPGSYHPSKSSYSYIDQVGDFKFEANLEYRFPLLGDFYGALFVDAGNVWLLKQDDSRTGGAFKFKNFFKELALGTGLGVRYDMTFLVIRFDVGVGIHAPYETGKNGYYNIAKFSDSLGFHFAVGYPF